MAAKGTEAKQVVGNAIVDLFKEQGIFVGVQDKKIYVKLKDGPQGDEVQIAISMTYAKNGIEPTQKAPQTSASANPTSPSIVELSPEDKAKIEELKRKLGIED